MQSKTNKKNKLPALQKIGVLDNSAPTTVMYSNVFGHLQIKVIQTNKKHFQMKKKRQEKQKIEMLSFGIA